MTPTEYSPSNAGPLSVIIENATSGDERSRDALVMLSTITYEPSRLT
jgi:hypothetical protein